MPYTIRKADQIITISEFTKADIIRQGWASESKIEVVHNSFDAGHFASDLGELPQGIAQFLRGRDYFLCVGHLEPRKNLKRIIQAFDAYRSQWGNDVALVIVGRKNHAFENLLNDVLVGSDASSSVLVTGFVSDEYLPVLYRMSKLFLFPSLHEGFGIQFWRGWRLGFRLLLQMIQPCQKLQGTQRYSLILGQWIQYWLQLLVLW